MSRTSWSRASALALLLCAMSCERCSSSHDAPETDTNGDPAGAPFASAAEADARVDELRAQLDRETEKVVKVGVERAEDRLYRVLPGEKDDEQLIIGFLFPQHRGKGKPERVEAAKVSFKRDPAFVYIIDVDGDVSRYPAATRQELQRVRVQREKLLEGSATGATEPAQTPPAP